MLSSLLLSKKELQFSQEACPPAATLAWVLGMPMASSYLHLNLSWAGWARHTY